MKQEEQRWLPFAWMGLEMPIREEWRPLKFSGNWAKGAVIVGNSDAPCFRVAWERVRPERFRPGRWLAERRKRRPFGVDGGRAPRPDGFDATLWAQDEKTRDGGRTSWCGYHAGAGVVLDVVIDPEAEQGVANEAMAEHVLPWLRAVPAGRSHPVAVFGAAFEAPAGFEIACWRFRLGDVVVQLERAAIGEVLTLRQVYPATLATSRQSLADWVTLGRIFPDRRRTQVLQPTTECRIDVNGRSLAGCYREMRRAYAFPLGKLRPVRDLAVGVLDSEVDRLYLVEHEARGEPSRALVERALAGMRPVLPGR